MHVRTVRKPGEPGTQRLVAKFGDRLVSVRYRYDAQKRKRFKTVELIIAEEDWEPPPQHDEIPDAQPVQRHTPMVAVRIHFEEKELQRQIKAIGGTWDAGKKLWFAPEEYVKRIGLYKRIVR